MARRRRPLDRTLTIRLDAKTARALKELAYDQQKSSSDVVRWILHDAVWGGARGPSALELSARYIGGIKEGPVVGGRNARKLLEDWVPDRRG